MESNLCPPVVTGAGNHGKSTLCPFRMGFTRTLIIDLHSFFVIYKSITRVVNDSNIIWTRLPPSQYSPLAGDIHAVAALVRTCIFEASIQCLATNLLPHLVTHQLVLPEKKSYTA